MKKELTIETRDTGYDDKDIQIVVRRKYGGTAPDVYITQTGMRGGQINISLTTAQKLIDALEYILK